MFDGLRNMAGMASLLKDLPKLQAQMEAVKASLVDVRVEASSGDGRVRAVADGTGQLIELVIDEGADAELAGDIRNTINTVLTMSREEAQRLLQAAAEELGLPLPSGGLGLPGGL